MLCLVALTKAGPIAAGQHVFGQVAGSLASHVLADSSLVVAMPPAVTFEQAATMPTVFMTADMAFNHAMHVVPGIHALLHAAAGKSPACNGDLFSQYTHSLMVCNGGLIRNTIIAFSVGDFKALQAQATCKTCLANSSWQLISASLYVDQVCCMPCHQ